MDSDIQMMFVGVVTVIKVTFAIVAIGIAVYVLYLLSIYVLSRYSPEHIFKWFPISRKLVAEWSSNEEIVRRMVKSLFLFLIAALVAVASYLAASTLPPPDIGMGVSGDRTSVRQGSEYRLASDVTENGIPANQIEAFQRLDASLSTAAKKALTQCEKEAYESKECQDFALYFRVPFWRVLGNHWMRPPDSPLARFYRGEGISNPELMVDSLMDAYTEYLRAGE